MQTGMSETDLNADQDVFFKRILLWKAIGRTFESVQPF
jgi:hypothetical protein